MALSGEDAAWLHMETDDNLMVIGGFLELARPLDLPRLEAAIRTRLLAHERFTHCVAEPRTHLGTPRWEPAPEFDLANHLVPLEPTPRDERELEAALGALFSEPLDRSRPLWRIHFVPRFGEGSLLVVRIHHSIADGFALMQVLLSLCDAGPSERGVRVTMPAPSVSAWRDAKEAVRQPWKVRPLVSTGARFTASLAHLVASPRDPATSLRGPIGVHKRVAWSRPIPLSRLKQLAHRREATINDLLVSCVAGSLRRYLAARRVATDLVLHAMMPVNLRSPEEALVALGNRFGLLIFPLPIAATDAAARLAQVKQGMSEAKRSPEAAVARGLLWTMGQLPLTLEKLAVTFFARKASLVLTNVPGPRQRVHLAGNAVSRMMFWVPQSRNLAVGISLISYVDEVVIGVMTDAGLVPDPQALIDGFGEELAALG